MIFNLHLGGENISVWLSGKTNAHRLASKTRLSSLYADFSALQATNPDGYAANIETWRTGLLQAARAGLLPGPDRLNLHTSDELAAVFEIPGLGRPLALQAVIVCKSWQRQWQRH